LKQQPFLKEPTLINVKSPMTDENLFRPDSKKMERTPPLVSRNDTILLATLQSGDVFQFAQRRNRSRTPDEYVPQWKVETIGTEFCEVTLEKTPGVFTRSSFPPPPMRLASSTLVFRMISQSGPASNG